MEWYDVINPERFSPDAKSIPDDPFASGVISTPVQKDADRVLFSSAFRRLQGKTQVFMFPETDYVRTRLTHTLEVASIGRILSSGIFERLTGDPKFSQALARRKLKARHVVDAIAAASYAHDIGNAPFGHNGEFAIRSWFEDRLDPNQSREGWGNFLKIKGDQRLADFTSFDGNAQAFRVVTRLQGWRNRGGLQLTCMTLGALIKYPFDSIRAQKSNGKFGYFRTEQEYFHDLMSKMNVPRRDTKNGVMYNRHPLSYIMEAADDIAYLTSDVEDGAKRGLIRFSDAHDILYDISKVRAGFDDRRLRAIKEKLGYDEYTSKIDHDQIKYLRSAAMLSLIELCTECFVDNKDKIIDGILQDKDLISLNHDSERFRRSVRTLNENNIYHEPGKVRREAGGYDTIRTLLDMFGQCLEAYFKAEGDIRAMNYRNRNLLSILTRGDSDVKFRHPYHAYRNLVDYVSGMTDRYAVRLCHELRGRPLG